MNQHSFLIIHGLGGSGADHWQTWLYHELIKKDFHVCYPTFTNYNAPDRTVWLKELSEAMATIPKNHQLTVITHSLGCLLWLHYVQNQNSQAAKQTILVAPPSPKVILNQAKSFYLPPLNGNKLLQASEETIFVHSTNDPYCSIEDASLYSKLGAASITFPDMGHINTDSGHGKWPWILDFCLTKSLVSI